MVNWGMIGGLIYNKTLACVLLLLIFAFRRNQRSLAKRALTVTASVYVCAIIVFLWQLLRYTGDKSHPVKQPVLPDPGYVDPAQLIVL